MRIADVEIVDAVAVGGGDICQAVRGRTTDGVPVFAKWIDNPEPGFFEAEAVGLDLIRVEGGPPVPAVMAVGSDGLVLEYVEPGRASSASAQDFGRALATVHRSGGTEFGADHHGFIGRRPQRNTPAEYWSTFYAERRLRPILRVAVDSHSIAPDDQLAVQLVIDRIADVAGPREVPALIHGDLWSGNVLWAADGQGWLIDAASAHNGHRETDLAMLQLFGAPHLDEIIASYDEVFPLSDGWQDRVGLHQLFPLLIHAAHFGGGYGAQAGRAARSLLPAR
jgi:fructosamine-3-kinase